MACCGGNKDDTEHEDVVQDLEAGVGDYENSEVAGYEQNVGKSLLPSFGNRIMYGVFGLLFAVTVITVVYRGLQPSALSAFLTRVETLEADLREVKRDTGRYQLLKNEVETLKGELDTAVKAGKLSSEASDRLKSSLGTSVDLAYYGGIFPQKIKNYLGFEYFLSHV
eukprot:461729_1